MSATTLHSQKIPINLLRGWPASSLLPADLISTAATKVLSNPSIYPSALWYGPDPGYEPLRHSIAAWLTDFYEPKDKIDSQRICITGGASQNLGCILSVFTDPAYTRNIWILAPAYFLAFRIFEDAGFGGRMRAVSEDIDLKWLRGEIDKSESDVRRRCKDEGREEKPRYKPQRERAKIYKHVIYCVPTFGNPSGRTMSLRQREELVKLARDVDALIVSDDVYDFLQWPATPKENQETMATAHIPRLVDIDRTIAGSEDSFGNIASNGSFSKIVAPGARVGWLESTPKFAYAISQTGTTCSGGAPGQLTSTYIHELVASGDLQKHIHNTLIPSYSLRYASMLDAIKTYLIPLGFALPALEDSEVAGGYFLWLTLPPASAFPASAKTLAEKCKAEEDVVIAGGNLFEVPDDRSVGFERNIRLCWAWEDEWKLEEGVKRVAGVVQRMMDEGFVVVEKDEGQGGGEVEGWK